MIRNRKTAQVLGRIIDARVHAQRSPFGNRVAPTFVRACDDPKMQHGNRRNIRKPSPGAGVVACPERHDVPRPPVGHHEHDVRAIGWREQDLAAVVLCIE